jgi:hypothetical protein
MATIPSSTRRANTETRAWREVVIGYVAATVGLVAYVTINGPSGVPTAFTVGTAGLVIIGLLLPSAGLLQLRTAVDPDRRAARYGLAMQSLGLVGLLLGVVAIIVSSSFSVWFAVSAVLIVSSAALALAGEFLLRGHYADVGVSNRKGVDYLIIGTALIFSGVAVILGSNVAAYFLLSDVGNTVFTDVGAAISACGCVIAAYSFYEMPNRG